VLLLPDGNDGGSYPLKQDKTVLGRTHGNILFLDDPFVSPVHATFFSATPTTIHVRDENSTNGLFLRLREEVELLDGDVLLLGKQLLRFEVLQTGNSQEIEIDLDGGAGEQNSPLWGSPYGPYWARLVQIIAGGRKGNAVLIAGDQVELGRERGYITFPGDGFISATHARISHRGGKAYLQDLGSRNGTFLRIRKEATLNHGDILIIGEQLFRIELSP